MTLYFTNFLGEISVYVEHVMFLAIMSVCIFHISINFICHNDFHAYFALIM